MLRFLFYANFDNKVGPQLPIAVPHPFLTQKELQELEGYLIPRRSLSHRLISFHWKSNIILNFPVRVEDSCYERHAFTFSFGMVLRKPPDIVYGNNEQQRDINMSQSSSADDSKIEIESFERILKRLTLIFLSLEKDFKFLSKMKRSDHYPAHFKFLKDEIGGNPNISEDHDYLLRKILMKIFNGFSRSGECTVNLLDSRKMALKLYNKLVSPQQVHWHDVPVLINDMNATDNRWDIALQFVLKQINSVNHVQRICDILRQKLVDVDKECIRECIEQLLYYKYIAITDIFKHSNYYIVTKNVEQILDSVQMQQSALAFISRDDRNLDGNAMEGVIEENEDDALNGGFDDEEMRMIYHLKIMYTKFDGKMTVKELMQKWKWNEHSVLKRFYVHKFVLFGTVNKLIRRIHRYPVVVKDVGDDADEMTKRLIALCDGSHCFDEICCALGQNQKTIKRMLRDSAVKYVELRK